MAARILLVSRDDRLAEALRSLEIWFERHEGGAVPAEVESLDAAVVDLTLPRAHELARALQRRALPVVAVVDGEDDLANAPQPLAGALVRPVSGRDLGVCLQNAIRSHAVNAAALQRAAWLQAALASTTEAVVGADANSRVTFLNAAAEVLTGWREAEAIGKPFDEVLRFEGEDGTHLGGISEPVTLTSRNGDTRLIEHSASPMLDPSGVLLGVVALIRDVTLRRSLEQRLTVADRMSSIGTLAAGVAHELNNPLSFVTSNLEFAIAELSRMTATAQGDHRNELEEVRISLRDAAAGAARAAEIVKDMKTFTRSVEARSKGAAVDVNQLVTLATRITGNTIRHRAELSLDLHADANVMADDGMLTQVFVNLLTNAAQAIDPGSARRLITVTSWSDASTTSVRVSDTGSGIPPENLPRIFEPFFTTKAVGQGTGLGLSLCHTIVSGLGGHIQVDSKVGVGTSFKVVLPRAVAGDAATAKPHAVPAPPRVLVIDDETLIGTAIRRILTKQGMEVVVVERGREGVDLILGGERFDAVFCDMMMPEFSGVDVYETLSDRAPAMKSRVIFMTGNAFASREHDLFSATKNVRIEKPFLPADLSAAIAEVLRRHVA